jgi:hypothetical protein
MAAVLKLFFRGAFFWIQFSYGALAVNKIKENKKKSIDNQFS